MTSGNIFKSDLNRLYNIVQNTATYRMKGLVLSSLRDFFKKDSFYRYLPDPWGYPLTPDHTNMPLDAGIADNSTTRLCIQEAFRFEANFFPALIVKAGGLTSVPISINRESGSIQYDDMLFEDGYGNRKAFRTPQSFIFAGAWEGNISIDILARDPRARDDLVDLISLLFTDIAQDELRKEGLVITGVSTSGSSEIDDRNDKLFKDTVQLKTRSEWRRHIPISNVIEIIHFAIDFGKLDDTPASPNLRIDAEIDLMGNLVGL